MKRYQLGLELDVQIMYSGISLFLSLDSVFLTVVCTHCWLYQFVKHMVTRSCILTVWHFQ